MAGHKIPQWALQEAVDLYARHKTHLMASQFASVLDKQMQPTGDKGIPRGTFETRCNAGFKRGLVASEIPKAANEKPRFRLKSDGTFEQISGEPVSIALDQTPLAERERIKFKDRIDVLTKQLTEAHRESLSAERIREEIFNLSRLPIIIPDWVVNSTSVAGAPGVPSTMWSDWHVGERVDRIEVAGVNEFNLEIAERRIKSLVERIVDLCIHHLSSPEYPGIVVNLGGDMISGDDLHDELTQTNEMRTAPTLVWLMGQLIRAIETMAERFGKVFVPCVVGNHGRMGKKPRSKQRVHTSYEWLLYTWLEQRFAGDDRVRFYIPGETDAHYCVAGHRYLLTHGDALGVKGGDGIIGALGPILRGTVKLHGSESQIGRDFDTVIMGHWHQYLPLPGVIVNGTLKGYDEYARLFLRARYQSPIQALWWTHPKRGVTFQVPVYLEDQVTVNQSDWVRWAA